MVLRWFKTVLVVILGFLFSSFGAPLELLWISFKGIRSVVRTIVLPTLGRVFHDTYAIARSKGRAKEVRNLGVGAGVQ